MVRFPPVDRFTALAGPATLDCIGCEDSISFSGRCNCQTQCGILPGNRPEGVSSHGLTTTCREYATAHRSSVVNLRDRGHRVCLRFLRAADAPVDPAPRNRAAWRTDLW